MGLGMLRLAGLSSVATTAAFGNGGAQKAWALDQESAGSSSTALEVLDVIKMFGRMANPSCFGSVAKHASCTIDTSSLGKQLFAQPSSSSSKMTKEELKTKVNEMAFEWPLKPYGTKEERVKTATLNKPAELNEWKNQAKIKNLGDPFYLNGKDRDRLNAAVGFDNVSDEALDALFNALSKDGKSIGEEDIQLLSGMDWFEFSSLIFNQQ